MATRDSQTLISFFRKKYPQYEKVDDASLFSAIQKKYPQYSDIKFDSIPDTENFLQKAIKESGAVGSSVTFPLPQMTRELSKSPLGGPVEYGQRFATGTLGKPAFEIPEAETGVGKFFETAAPVAIGGYGLGKAGLSAGKSGIKYLFGKQLAKRELPEATRKLTVSIQKLIGLSKNNPSELSVPKKEVTGFLESQFSKARVPKGEQAQEFRRWIRALKDPKKFPEDNLTADVLSEIETKFGKVAKFGKGSNDPILQQGAKEVNRFASKELDVLAEKAGVPEFIEGSIKKSKLLRQTGSKPSYLGKLAKKVLEGGVMTLGGKIVYDILKKD